MSRCRFIDYNKRSIPEGDFDSGGGCMYVGGESTQEISVSATQFCSDPKIPLKNKMCLNPFLKEEGK